jgi:glycosyltransferase involved in cell wall biosynthesis
MLGWECPPYIGGGLGTACRGLTKALSHAGADIMFVLPRAVDSEHASHAPVIISKSSGVSEVLEHALKVDFWDIGEMANTIVAVLRHPPFASTLRENASAEIRQMTWDKAAGACLRLYHALLRTA